MTGPVSPTTVPAELQPTNELPPTNADDHTLPVVPTEGEVTQEVSETIFQIAVEIDGNSVELGATELEGMIDAAASAAGVDIGNRRSETKDQVSVYGLEAAQAELIKQELLSDNGTPYFEETQKFGAQIAGDMKYLGAMAIVFSFIGIITYIWLRFQQVSFGIAAVVALVHDVLVTLAAIAVSKYLAEPLGVLGVEDFKISLPVICLLYTSPSPRDQRGSRVAWCAW